MASIQIGERRLGLEKTVEKSGIRFYLYVLCTVTTEEIKWAASLPPYLWMQLSRFCRFHINKWNNFRSRLP
jgi:hypothetical protein